MKTYLKKTHLNGQIEIVAFNSDNLTVVSTFYNEIQFDRYEDSEHFNRVLERHKEEFYPATREEFNDLFLTHVQELNSITKEL